jgi:hypothetical protein
VPLFRLFDLCNVRSAEGATGPSEGRRTRNPDLLPYRSADDPRLLFFAQLQVYLQDWHSDNARDFGIGNYDNFLSAQCYKVVIQYLFLSNSIRN